MKRYVIAPEAAEDIKAIRAYLKREAGLAVANSTLKKIRDAFELLRRNPGLGHIREDLTDEPVKFWAVFPYLIIYNPTAYPIEIVRVLHGKRDLAAILSQDD
jgi:plasmid stabilization system protein ParE